MKRATVFPARYQNEVESYLMMLDRAAQGFRIVANKYCEGGDAKRDAMDVWKVMLEIREKSRLVMREMMEGLAVNAEHPNCPECKEPRSDIGISSGRIPTAEEVGLMVREAWFNRAIGVGKVAELLGITVGEAKEITAGWGLFSPLYVALDDLCGVIDAHDTESLQCDGKEARYCDCLSTQVRKSKLALKINTED